MLIESNAKAVKEIVGISSRELTGVGERSAEGVGVGVVLNGFDNITETLSFKVLLSHDNMNIINVLLDIRKVTFMNITRVDWVSHKSLVVWNWPGWGRHNSKR